ncbi:MAG TPA: FecR family protein [Spirochaetota bacterium]|nr:FecR family protein [Spirochaetota bacterium]HOM37538.1 FecR family protein [Spirochaetota bacterium]HPQ49490.1 FecR family protein [Spirochaetota bacterium]
MRVFFIIQIFILFSVNIFAIRFQVTYVIGNAEYNTVKDSKYSKIKVNEIIEDIKTVRTGKNSYLKIISSDNRKFFVYPESTLSFIDSNTSFLHAGESEFIVDRNHTVKTLALVVGVRGTIFRVSAAGALNKVVLYDGIVEVSDTQATGYFSLTKGQKFEWDTSYSFKEARVSNATIEELEFKIDKLDPKLSYIGPDSTAITNVKSEYPDVTSLNNIPDKTTNLVQAEEKKEKEDKINIEKLEENKQREDEGIKRVSDIFDKKKDKVFSLSIGLGSVSKDNYFYKTLFFKPYFKIRDNIKLELFLPLIIDGRVPIYNISKWGNYDEFNFSNGSDIINDIFLKISYFQYNDRSDLLFIRLGELNNIVIANGFMVNYFDNSGSVFDRKIGAEVAIDNGNFGVEGFVNNVTDPEIIFINMFLRPFYGVPFMGKFRIGLEIDIDKNPLSDFNNPAYFYVGINSLIPLLGGNIFNSSIVFDIGKQGLYYRHWETRPASWADGTDFAHFHLFDNYGAGLGFTGKIVNYVNYRFYYSYLHSGFLDSYFDKMCYVKRASNILYMVTPSKSDDHSFKANIGFEIPSLFSFEGGTSLYLKKNDMSFSFVNVKTTDVYGFFIDLYYQKLLQGFSIETYDKDSILLFSLTYMIAPNAYISFKKFWMYNTKGEKENRVMLITYVRF